MSPAPRSFMSVGFGLLLALVSEASGQEDDHILAESHLINGSMVDIGNQIGAQAYYTRGITGQNTITANLEAGHIWNGHESLQHVTNYFASANTWSNGNVNALYDRHATWVGMVIGGRQTATNGDLKQQGIAYGTTLISRAIASSWTGSAYAQNFNITTDTYRTALTNAFAQADVINSSYGYTDPSGSNNFTEFTDALARSNPTKTYVVSAGNSGPGANTVGAPGSGYNTITVGALSNAPGSYGSVASFSSRGPQDFLTYSNGSPVVVAGVRAAVDISAPGTSIQSAYFGGQSGGNNPTLSNSTPWVTNASAYSVVQGTSFASPIVAGGVALMVSSAKRSLGPEALQSVVLKSILLTSADKTTGWSNGQSVSNGIVTTTQSLDWATGAGEINLVRAANIQNFGSQGIPGTNTGSQGVALSRRGWDFGAAQLGLDNDYTIGGRLLGGSTFTTTLSWLRERGYTLPGGSIDAFDRAQADLNLSLWQLGVNNVFESVVAQSISLYNVVEHLSFTLPTTGYYGLRVSYGSNTFDLTGNWGTAGNLQSYGVAWEGTSVAGDQVAFRMQTNRFNAILTEKNDAPPYAGVFDNGTNEVGLYANQGSFGNTPGAAAFQTLTTTGNGNTGAARPMQAGDTFTITAFTSANPSPGGRVGIAFRDGTNYTNFFSSTDGDTEARLQLDSSGNWKIYEGGTERMTSGSGAGADRSLVLKVTSDTTFDAQIGGTWYRNFVMGAGGGLIDSFALYAYGASNSDVYWKNGMLEDTGTVELGYALGSATSRTHAGNVFTPGVITDTLAATSNVTVRTNAVFIGGDAGSQVNLVNSNSYSGLTTVNSNATLEVRHANALGTTSAGTRVLNGGALRLYSASNMTVTGEGLGLAGSGVGSTNGALRSVGGTNTWTWVVALDANARINADTSAGPGSLTLSGNVSAGTNILSIGANGANISISGAITGTGATTNAVVTSLIKDGASTLTLSGSNTFTGAARVAAGTLEAAGTGGNAALGATASVRVDSGATLLISTDNQVSNTASITLSGGTILRGAGVDEVFGNLNLTQASFIDYGSGAGGFFRFGTYSPTFLLSVANFVPGNSLIFASDLTASINNNTLFSFSHAFSANWSGTEFTITAIPEASSLFAAVFVVAAGAALTIVRPRGGVARRWWRRR